MKTKRYKINFQIEVEAKTDKAGNFMNVLHVFQLAIGLVRKTVETFGRDVRWISDESNCQEVYEDRSH